MFGLLEVGDTILDPFGNDPEDYAVVHFVEHTAFASLEATRAKPAPLPNKGGLVAAAPAGVGPPAAAGAASFAGGARSRPPPPRLGGEGRHTSCSQSAKLGAIVRDLPAESERSAHARAGTSHKKSRKDRERSVKSPKGRRRRTASNAAAADGDDLNAAELNV